jgi:hypothetical protein
MFTAGELCRAIRDCLLIEFDYGGSHRVVAPYCHGFSRRGLEVLRGVQVRGKSSSGGFGFGKLWALAEIRALRITSETFVPDDPHYNPDDNAMREIHCRVERIAPPPSRRRA